MTMTELLKQRDEGLVGQLVRVQLFGKMYTGTIRGRYQTFPDVVVSNVLGKESVVLPISWDLAQRAVQGTIITG